MKIFISHTHADQGLADALRAFIKNLFGDKVQVAYSSDQTAGGGINPGEDWLAWILRQVKEAQRTFVLLTPRSTSKPWVLWETGAVTGAAIATGSKESLAPVIFRVDMDQVPGPMARQQGVNGEDPKGIRRLLQSLNGDLGNHLPETAFDPVVNAYLPGYLSTVQQCLADQPLALNEAAVQEWVSRIEDLRAEKRFSEVKHLHRALLIAYGEAGVTGEPLLDQRIHRRLGEMYLATREPVLAATQFELALRTGSRDIFLLHKLALAETEAANLSKATEVLDRISKVDPAASVRSAEVAGIRGRIFRERWKQTGAPDDLRKARDAYAIQLTANPRSYYMADNVGQLSLHLGEREAARTAFEQAVAIIRESQENSVWSNATLATAAIVLGDEAAVLAALVKLKSLHPAPRDLESIAGGLERVHAALGLPAERLARCKETLAR